MRRFLILVAVAVVAYGVVLFGMTPNANAPDQDFPYEEDFQFV